MAVTLQQMRAANKKVNPKAVTPSTGEGLLVKTASTLGAVVPAVRTWGDMVAESYRYHENIRRGLIS